MAGLYPGGCRPDKASRVVGRSRAGHIDGVLLPGDRMMQTSNRLFDDIARIAGGAMQTISGVREEIELRVKERVERMLADLDLVNREDFDAVKAMAAKAREEQEAVAARLAEVERELAELKGGRRTRTGPARPRAARGRTRKAEPAAEGG
jgi:hypothetical protein